MIINEAVKMIIKYLIEFVFRTGDDEKCTELSVVWFYPQYRPKFRNFKLSGNQVNRNLRLFNLVYEKEVVHNSFNFRELDTVTWSN